MSHSEVKVTRMSCDGCGRSVLIEEGEAAVGWYVGQVIHHHGGGGDGGRWEACSAKCLKKAVLGVVVGRPEERW